jgi:hypothetical protein
LRCELCFNEQQCSIRMEAYKVGEYTKLCTKCHSIKSASEFNKNKWKSDGFQHYCRECHRKSVVGSQRTHREAFLKRLQRYNDRKRNESRRHVFDYLSTHPCIDCGESDVIVLDFDHQRDKKHTISQLIISNKPWSYILNEIEKCEVRYANCHRKRTAEKFGWKKFKWQADSHSASN